MGNVLRLVPPDTEVLTRPAARVESPEQISRDLVRDLITTILYLQNCVALAAPQIGIDGCFYIIGYAASSRPGEVIKPFTVVINPEVLSESREQLIVHGVSCATFSEKYGFEKIPVGTIRTPRKLQIRFRDWAADQEVTETVEGFGAVVNIHEIDHVSKGKYFTHRVVEGTRLMPRYKFRRLKTKNPDLMRLTLEGEEEGD